MRRTAFLCLSLSLVLWLSFTSSACGGVTTDAPEPAGDTSQQVDADAPGNTAQGAQDATTDVSELGDAGDPIDTSSGDPEDGTSGPDATTPTCVVDADCDDGIPCTVETLSLIHI